MKKAAVIVLAALLAAVAALVALPFAATCVDWPEMTFDLSTNITGNAAGLFSNRTVRVKIGVSRNAAGGGFLVVGRGSALDWPFVANAVVRFGFSGAVADASVAFPGTPWRADARMSASPFSGWKVSLDVPETEFSEEDPILGNIAAAAAGSSVSNVAFSGVASLSASACRTNGMYSPRWEGECRLKGLSAFCDAGSGPVSVANARVRLSASGSCGRTDLRSFHPRADCISAAGLSLTNAFAHVLPDGPRFVVTEAGGGFCGGDVRVYAMYLDPESLNLGFTLLLDEIDVGEVLSRTTGFRGEASGRLHGKFPMRMKNGRLSLGDMYLYSKPGETGTIRVEDPEPMMENFAGGGMSPEARGNLARALGNLTYEVLKIDLKSAANGDSTLGVGIRGFARSGETEVPVSLQLNFHGEIERIVNLGLKAGGGVK